MQCEDLIRFVWGGCSWGKFLFRAGGNFFESAASRPVGGWGAERHAGRSVSGECNILMVAEIYPPLISRLRDKLLAVFFPPEGKPFIRPCEHGEYNFGKQTKNQETSRITKATKFPNFHTPALL